MLSGEESQIHVERSGRACLDGERQPDGFRAEPSRDGDEANDHEGVFGLRASLTNPVEKNSAQRNQRRPICLMMNGEV